jgi:S-DNA-T family DNA segregation ATPase FtsK/SpoIIIE
MEMRYEALEKGSVRNIGDFNRRYPDDALPYLVVVIDELADLMITAGREVEEPIIRIAQLARAVGIHLIVATQRPSVDVITGIIKANFPARIAFQVASRVDSRTILDGSGAEQLLGNGDMLYQPSNQPKPIRIQSPYVSSSEVEEITSFIGAQHALKNIYVLPMPDVSKNSNMQGGSAQDRDGRDAMFEEAARLVVMHQQASVSLLQRRLRLGFSRAGRVMDQLEANGIVGEADGSKSRDVLIKNEDSLELLLRNLD